MNNKCINSSKKMVDFHEIFHVEKRGNRIGHYRFNSHFYDFLIFCFVKSLKSATGLFLRTVFYKGLIALLNYFLIKSLGFIFKTKKKKKKSSEQPNGMVPPENTISIPISSSLGKSLKQSKEQLCVLWRIYKRAAMDNSFDRNNQVRWIDGTNGELIVVHCWLIVHSSVQWRIMKMVGYKLRPSQVKQQQLALLNSSLKSAIASCNTLNRKQDNWAIRSFQLWPLSPSFLHALTINRCFIPIKLKRTIITAERKIILGFSIDLFRLYKTKEAANKISEHDRKEAENTHLLKTDKI